MKFLFNLFAVVMLFVIGTPLAMAQDSTDEAPIIVVDDGGELVSPVESPVPSAEERATVTLRDAVIAIVVVVATAIGSIAVILSRTSANVVGIALDRLHSSVPSYLQPSFASAIGAGVGRLKEVATSTQFTDLDDEFVATLERVVAPIVERNVVEIAKRFGGGQTDVSKPTVGAVG